MKITNIAFGLLALHASGCCTFRPSPSWCYSPPPTPGRTTTSGLRDAPLAATGILVAEREPSGEEPYSLRIAEIRTKTR
jgi:hypothetical protein